MDDLINMSKYYEEQLEDLTKKVKNEKEKAEWEEAARKLRLYYDSMVKAGFTDEQAWWFVTAAVRQAWGIS